VLRTVARFLFVVVVTSTAALRPCHEVTLPLDCWRYRPPPRPDLSQFWGGGGHENWPAPGVTRSPSAIR
jgi:hypothetical protein